jgi:hypothetical protein
VLKRERFVRKLLAVDALAARTVAVGEVAALRHCQRGNGRRVLHELQHRCENKVEAARRVLDELEEIVDPVLHVALAHPQADLLVEEGLEKALLLSGSDTSHSRIYAELRVCEGLELRVIEDEARGNSGYFTLFEGEIHEFLPEGRPLGFRIPGSLLVEHAGGIHGGKEPLRSRRAHCCTGAGACGCLIVHLCLCRPCQYPTTTYYSCHMFLLLSESESFHYDTDNIHALTPV